MKEIIQRQKLGYPHFRNPPVICGNIIEQWLVDFFRKCDWLPEGRYTEGCCSKVELWEFWFHWRNSCDLKRYPLRTNADSTCWWISEDSSFWRSQKVPFDGWAFTSTYRGLHPADCSSLLPCRKASLGGAIQRQHQWSIVFPNGWVGVPSGNLLHSYWKWPVIVDFPIKNCDFP